MNKIVKNKEIYRKGQLEPIWIPQWQKLGPIGILNG